MLGLDTLCVPHAEMFPEQFMPEPFSPWAISVFIWGFAALSAGLSHTRQASATVSL